jgi:hypothetical protein
MATDSLEDVTHAELMRAIAGHHAWKIPEGDAPELVDHCCRTIAPTPTTPYPPPHREPATKLLSAAG